MWRTSQHATAATVEGQQRRDRVTVEVPRHRHDNIVIIINDEVPVEVPRHGHVHTMRVSIDVSRGVCTRICVDMHMATRIELLDC